MEAGFIAIAAMMLVIGIIIGIRIERSKWKKIAVKGALYINPQAPEGQGLFLEQLASTEEIASGKYVIFETVVIKQNSQK